METIIQCGLKAVLEAREVNQVRGLCDFIACVISLTSANWEGLLEIVLDKCIEYLNGRSLWPRAFAAAFIRLGLRTPMMQSRVVMKPFDTLLTISEADVLTEFFIVKAIPK